MATDDPCVCFLGLLVLSTAHWETDQQKCILSQLRRLGVWNSRVGRVATLWGLWKGVIFVCPPQLPMVTHSLSTLWRTAPTTAPWHPPCMYLCIAPPLGRELLQWIRAHPAPLGPYLNASAKSTLRSKQDLGLSSFFWRYNSIHSSCFFLWEKGIEFTPRLLLWLQVCSLLVAKLIKDSSTFI